eukprot:1154663-Pelagomonas_calceolata.AAC.6
MSGGCGWDSLLATARKLDQQEAGVRTCLIHVEAFQLPCEQHVRLQQLADELPAVMPVQVLAVHGVERGEERRADGEARFSVRSPALLLALRAVVLQGATRRGPELGLCCLRTGAAGKRQHMLLGQEGTQPPTESAANHAVDVIDVSQQPPDADWPAAVISLNPDSSMPVMIRTPTSHTCVCYALLPNTIHSQ